MQPGSFLEADKSLALDNASSYSTLLGNLWSPNYFARGIISHWLGSAKGFSVAAELLVLAVLLKHVLRTVVIKFCLAASASVSAVKCSVVFNNAWYELRLKK